MTAPLPAHAPPGADQALGALLRALADRDYAFVTPTPASHQRVLRRADKRVARSLRDVFGWSLPFEAGLLDAELADLLRQAGAVAPEQDGRSRSRVRVSSLGGLLFAHSAFPTEDEDSVFFGPDSYRFARFIEDRLAPRVDRPRIVDVGAGAGVGGIVAGRRLPSARVLLTDVNRAALRLAAVNAGAAGVGVELREAEGLKGIEGAFDAVLINPPYIIDPAGRAYRDGGDMHGGELALDLALEAAERLAPGGQLLLYTGAAIVGGKDPLADALRQRLAGRGFDLDYRERDPDVFGEELEKPEYADVERIAVVEAVITRSA